MELADNPTSSRDAFHTLAENAPDVIVRFDRALRHVYVNPAVERMTGLPPRAYIGRTCHEVGPPAELRDSWIDLLRRCFDQPREYVHELTFDSDTGRRWYQARVVPEYG